MESSNVHIGNCYCNYKFSKLVFLLEVKKTFDSCRSISNNGVCIIVFQLQEAGKSSRITNFQDISISSSLPVLDLVDAIKPGTVKYDMVSQGSSEKVSNNT